MKRFLSLLGALLLVPLALAQNVSHGPVTKITSGANKNSIDEDLTIGSGRTLKVATGGTANLGNGTLSFSSNQIPWTAVNKTGSNLNEITTRNFADLQNKPTTLSGYGITDPIASTSQVNARAPRQGLVFDGTAGATVANVPAFGTGDFTLHAVGKVDTLAPAAQVIFANSAGGSVPQTHIDSTGAVVVAGSASIISSSVITAGKWFTIDVVRSSGVTTIYVNAASVRSAADTKNDSNAIDEIGRNSAGNFFTGTLSVLIYNRALSASEVQALYESGAPAASDYNNASNTPAYSANFSAGTDSFAASLATAIGNVDGIGGRDDNLRVTLTGGSSSTHQVSRTFATKLGGRYQYSVDVFIPSTNATPFGLILLANGGSLNLASTTTRDAWVTLRGEFAETSDLSARIRVDSVVNSDGDVFYVRNFTVTNRGLLLAPDTAQPGAGLSWYDVSGNSANITLPASGVTWAKPSSGTIPGPIALNTGAASSLGTNVLTFGETGTVANSYQQILFRNTQQGWIQGAIRATRQAATNNFNVDLYAASAGTLPPSPNLSLPATGGATVTGQLKVAHATTPDLWLQNSTGAASAYRNVIVRQNADNTFKVFSASDAGVLTRDNILTASNDTGAIGVGVVPGAGVNSLTVVGAIHSGQWSRSTNALQFDSYGSGSGINIYRQNLSSDPGTLAAGDRLFVYVPDATTGLRIGTDGASNLLTISPAGNLGVNGTVAIGGTSSVKGIRTATAAPAMGTVSANAQSTTTITVTGAAVGDDVSVSGLTALPPANIYVWGYVSAANTVTVVFDNPTNAGIVWGTRSLRVTVISF